MSALIWPRVMLGVLVAGLLWWAVDRLHDYVWQNGYNAANVRAEQVIAEFIKGEAEAQRQAREAERAKQDAVDAAAAAYQRGLADAETTERDVLSDLRADNLRLRAEWRGCATDRLAGDAEAASRVAAADRSRAALAAAAVRIGAECDARDRAWRQYAAAVAGEGR